MKNFFQSENVRVIKAQRAFAERMFQLIDQNRTRLQAVFPWVDKINSVEDQMNFYSKAVEHWEQRTAFHFVLQVNNEFVGAVSVQTIDWVKGTCEFGYWLGHGFEGQKIATRALLLLETALAEQEIKKVLIKTHDFNKPSQKLALSLGYTLTREQFEGFFYAEKNL